MLRFTVMMIGAFLVAACNNQPRTSAPRGLVDGNYHVVSSLRPNSVQTIHLTVINNFECRVCAEFDAKLPALKAKYGERLSIDYLDVYSSKTKAGVIAHHALRDSPRAAELRKFLFANHASAKAGQTDPATLIAKFNIAPDIFTDHDVLRSVARRDNEARRLADSTPTILLEGQIAMAGDVGKISHVIDQLLIKEGH